MVWLGIGHGRQWDGNWSQPPSHIFSLFFFFFFFFLRAQRVGGQPSHDAGELRRSLWSAGNYRITSHPPPGLCLLSVFRCACQ